MYINIVHITRLTKNPVQQTTIKFLYFPVFFWIIDPITTPPIPDKRTKVITVELSSGVNPKG